MTSLRLPAQARYFVSVTGISDLTEALAWAATEGQETLLLGGGSNLVLAGDYNGLVIRMAFPGRRWEDVSEETATLVLGAGENWHEAVIHAASEGYRGIENLALIPGSTGAAPVQNIGAYGAELKDTLVSVTAYDCGIGKPVTLSNADCRFRYRDSLFKQEPGRYIIVEIRLGLSRTRPFTLGYGELKTCLGDCPGPGSLTPLQVAEAVMTVRRRKLPDPDQLPNAGSFFKNPLVPLAHWKRLQARYPAVVGFPGESTAKLAAAWLIDQCGWKGYRDRRVGVHDRQALVLINHDGGTGDELLALAERIQEDVKNRFGVALEVEPRIIR
ncbi:MAG: UDP-N-acetylmuramate dehydrogenase [Oleiphilaceae bacterium]|nr:UDP-N-acetylmuramate dehydrogenase [Oleiphilaceae bacterium]